MNNIYRLSTIVLLLSVVSLLLVPPTNLLAQNSVCDDDTPPDTSGLGENQVLGTTCIESSDTTPPMCIPGSGGPIQADTLEGVPQSDPELTAFLESFDCDDGDGVGVDESKTTLTLPDGSELPDPFPIGSTTVKQTCVDLVDNTSMCEATIEITPPEDPGKCEGVTLITVDYDGGVPVTITTTDKKDNILTVDFIESLPGSVTVTVDDLVDDKDKEKGKLPSNTNYLTDDGEDPVQIHTSCSKPINIGDEHGPYTIITLCEIFENGSEQCFGDTTLISNSNVNDESGDESLPEVTTLVDESSKTRKIVDKLLKKMDKLPENVQTLLLMSESGEYYGPMFDSDPDTKSYSISFDGLATSKDGSVETKASGKIYLETLAKSKHNSKYSVIGGEIEIGEQYFDAIFGQARSTTDKSKDKNSMVIITHIIDEESNVNTLKLTLKFETLLEGDYGKEPVTLELDGKRSTISKQWKLSGLGSLSLVEN